MRNLLPIVASLLLLPYCAATTRAQEKPLSLVSPEEANRIVHDTAGEPVEKITVLDLAGRANIPEMYRLQVDNREYQLRSDTRAYFSWNIFKTYHKYDEFYGQPFESTSLAARMKPEKELRNIAVTYMREHYPDPDRLNKLECKMEGASSAAPVGSPVFFFDCLCTFSQQLSNGAVGPSSCTIEVDSVFGSIVRYHAWTEPVLISPVPALSPQQAMSIAIQTLASQGGPTSVNKLYITNADAFGLQRLCYSLRFGGELKGQPGYSDWGVDVDANTGEVLWLRLITGLGGPSKHPIKLLTHLSKRELTLLTRLALNFEGRDLNAQYPPIEVHGQPYCYVGFLLFGQKDGKLGYDRGTVTVSTASARRTLHLGSREYQFEGQTKSMSSPALIINGRCYVPLAMLSDAAHMRTEYDSKTRTVVVRSLAGTADR